MSNKLKIALAQLSPLVGDVERNVSKLIEIRSKLNDDIDILVAPELYVSGYPIDDLVLREDFLKSVELGIENLVSISKDNKSSIIIGAPRKFNNSIRNSVFVIENGKILTIKDKYELPNTGVFDEQRIFSQGQLENCVKIKNVNFGLPICEDIWEKRVLENLSTKGAEIIISINASPYTIVKKNERDSVAALRVNETNLPLIYLNRTGGQDELIFDGSSMAISNQGKLIHKALSFKEENKIINYPLRSKKIRKIPPYNIDSIFNALVLGVKDYVTKNNFTKVVIGISGGIDSALVSAISKVALGGKNIYGFALPSEYNSDESLKLAKNLSDNLGFKLGELSIKKIFNENISLLYSTLFKDLKWDIAEENLQSRIRSNLLMAISNKFNYLLLSTGNKSEMSVGYSTIYGDLSGGLAPLKDIPKTLVYKIAKFYNKKYPNSKIPLGIINREPSAELRPNQKDSDSLPAYEDLDKILYLYVENFLSINEIYIATKIEKKIIKKIVDLIDKNEFKRRQGPPGIKVTNVAFGKDRRFPITNGFKNY